MKHFRYWSLSSFVFDSSASFGTRLQLRLPHRALRRARQPDNYNAFLKGDLQVLQPGFHTRHLVVAYRYFSGKPLSPQEQKDVATVHSFYLNSDSGSDTSKTPDPLAAWMDARKKIDLKDADFPYPEDGIRNERNIPGEDYSSFTDCLDAAFTTALATLNTRTQQHGAKDPAVFDWLRAQDAVFSNCSGRNVAPILRPPAKSNQPLPAPHMPAGCASKRTSLAQAGPRLPTRRRPLLRARLPTPLSPASAPSPQTPPRRGPSLRDTSSPAPTSVRPRSIQHSRPAARARRTPSPLAQKATVPRSHSRRKELVAMRAEAAHVTHAQ